MTDRALAALSLTDFKDLVAPILARAYFRLWRAEVDIVRVMGGVWFINNWIILTHDAGEDWSVHVDLPPGHPAWTLLPNLARQNQQRIFVNSRTRALLLVLGKESHLRNVQALEEAHHALESGVPGDGPHPALIQQVS